MTMANLPASATGYDVYVYTQGDNGGVTRTATFQLSGSGVSTTAVSVTDLANSPFKGVFTQANNSAGNYVKFSAITATTFTLTATSGTSTNTAKRAPVNGLQIVPSPGGGTPDFSVSVSGTQTVSQGAAAGYTVGVTAANGFSSSLGLSVSGLPAGASAAFNPASLSSGNGNSALSVSTGSSTPSGTYTLTITGSSGSLVHTATTQLVVTGSSGGGTAAAISIDFQGTGTPMASTETAGVVGKTHWNELATAASSSPVALMNENGVSTGATVTWKADNNWMLPITDSPGNVRMMKGYLDNSGGHPTTVTMANLPASATGYDVYVYTQGDNGGVTRTATFQLSGSGVSTTAVSVTDLANSPFKGVFTQANNSAGNYVKFSAITATAFTLTATSGTSTDTAKRAPVNGLQIVPH